jgi:hypothetical protein
VRPNLLGIACLAAWAAGPLCPARADLIVDFSQATSDSKVPAANLTASANFHWDSAHNQLIITLINNTTATAKSGGPFSIQDLDFQAPAGFKVLSFASASPTSVGSQWTISANKGGAGFGKFSWDLHFGGMGQALPPDSTETIVLNTSGTWSDSPPPNPDGNLGEAHFFAPEASAWGSGHIAPVPEPASLAMFGLGIVGLVGYRWRRRRRPS